MTPDPDRLLWRRRSFLGWTAALGAALLTRPALAVPERMVEIVITSPTIKEPYAVFTTEGGEIFRVPVYLDARPYRVDSPELRGKRFQRVEIVAPCLREQPLVITGPGMHFR